MAVYYLGVYGFGASVTTQDERATRLVRFDGIERLALVCGPLLAGVFYEQVWEKSKRAEVCYPKINFPPSARSGFG